MVRYERVAEGVEHDEAEQWTQRRNEEQRRDFRHVAQKRRRANQMKTANTTVSISQT